MISSFWLGECVWDINVMLWQNFGKEISVFDQVMKMERIGPTVHGRPPDRVDRPPPLRGQSARPRQRLPCAVASRLGFYDQLKLHPNVNTH
jgi:hypothetical protein